MSPDSAVGPLLMLVDGGRSPPGVAPLGVLSEAPPPLVGGPGGRRRLRVPSRVEMKVMTGSLSSECRLHCQGRRVRGKDLIAQSDAGGDEG